jgi:phosphoribosylformylglycinamidine cyclo-ligase
MTETTDQAPLSYRDAGVDVEAADAFVDKIGSLVKSTHAGIDVISKTAYAGMVRPNLTGMNSPLIAATCDGVGTKLIVARDANHFSGLGQDLVAMNVNDLLPAAARPLLFLDYLATGKLDPEQLEIIVASVAQACRESGCALIGGETAEMPDVYAEGDFDLAGFAVGIADEDRVPTPSDMAAGDIILGLPSTGVHSNGLSLARRALFDRAGYTTETEIEGLEENLGKTVLAPTALYVKPVMALLEKFTFTGAAHITGGGLLGRTLKLVKDGLGMTIDPNSYTRPPIFKVIQDAGNVTDHEMASTFNMGIGFVVIVSPEDADKIQEAFPDTWMRVGHLHNEFEGVDLGYARS